MPSAVSSATSDIDTLFELGKEGEALNEPSSSAR